MDIVITTDVKYRRDFPAGQRWLWTVKRWISDPDQDGRLVQGPTLAHGNVSTRAAAETAANAVAEREVSK